MFDDGYFAQDYFALYYWGEWSWQVSGAVDGGWNSGSGASAIWTAEDPL